MRLGMLPALLPGMGDVDGAKRDTGSCEERRKITSRRR